MNRLRLDKGYFFVHNKRSNFKLFEEEVRHESKANSTNNKSMVKLDKCIALQFKELESLRE